VASTRAGLPASEAGQAIQWAGDGHAPRQAGAGGADVVKTFYGIANQGS
jgi:hypothetical protein